MDIYSILIVSIGNAYKVDFGRASILLEAGLPIKKLQEACGYKITDLTACFISHAHLDHAKSWKEIAKKGVDVYMTEGTARALGAMREGGSLCHHRVRILTRSEGHAGGYAPVSILGDDYMLKIIPFKTIHDCSEPVGYLIRYYFQKDGIFCDTKDSESLAFATDTAYITVTFPKVDYYMLEVNHVKAIMDDNLGKAETVNFRNRVANNHMSLETAVEFFKANDLSKVKRIYLLHLSDANSDEQMIKTEIQRFTGKEVVVC